ncbi:MULTISPECIES: asparagine synthase (glutamine-hydrolyzing) [unclassified Pseudomonas]|uniref:asparagine synthase (glutamine-hydrolyzing) n=1 Tax=unclassified Pseudomonas TaxID=196821 RepID=UPI000F79AA29|nr:MULTISPECIES: asparagine synthase (glutamine-hydrolyzing) [unclassified Pseudomonas]RRV44840.1 asparagine synthase (glutamine-hydrolyzing) [Pseudomonas sp. p106]
MCGILGGVWKQVDSSLESRVKSALATIRHRGPNDSGYEVETINDSCVVLGHTRLSVIDLSEAGHQPMYSQDRRYSMVFNGEIYNYKELRSELESFGYLFVSDSDTEVLLVAWQHWQEASLKRFVGMFAFAIYDHWNSTIHCARDAFGIKPFFYSIEKSGLCFASELSAVKELKGGRAELNWQRAYDYLTHGDYDTNDQTFFKDVFHLPPGHIASFDINNCKLLQLRRWYTPTLQERNDLSFAAAADELRERFLDSIRLHLRSDVPLGAALSGGLDSSAVVCAMRYIDPKMPIHTFSYIAQGSTVSEEYWADQINEYVGAHANKVIVSPTDLIRDLDDLIKVQGEPFGSTSIYAQYRVYQLARDCGVTVTLDGQGADEMLAGYTGYPGQRIRSMVERGEYARAVNFLNKWTKWPGRSLTWAVGSALGQFTSGRVNDFLRALDGRQNVPSWIDGGVLADGGVRCENTRRHCDIQLQGRRLTSELATSLHYRGLQHLLRHGDRNSMRFSIESRVPFLTTGLTEFLLSLPEHYLISDSGETKHIFRAAMRGIVPDQSLDRRDKIGFQTPEKDLLLSNAPVIRKWLEVDLELPFIRGDQILSSFDRAINGKAKFSAEVWRWINFYRWYQAVLA